MRSSITGWSLPGLERNGLTQELSRRNPHRHMQLRLRALSSLAQAAIRPAPGLNRHTALQEFFYLLGDSLVRAALYHDETQARGNRYLESAGSDDIEVLGRYMQAWRTQRVHDRTALIRRFWAQ